MTPGLAKGPCTLRECFQSPKRLAKAFLKAPFEWRASRRNQRALANHRYKLAICAIFREEAPFLDEWINFHVGVGVDQFYLYNNFSTDDFQSVLKPAIEQGLVTLVDWPHPVGQISAYRDCLAKHGREALWIALIDVDEFLFSPLEKHVPTILERYQDLPGVSVWQAFFGSSGHVRRPSMPVTQAYTMRAGPEVTTVKTIVNPRMVYRVGVHESKFWKGENQDTERRRIVSGMTPVFDTLRINHYWSRSIEDLEQKIRRGDASTPTPRDREWHLAFEHKLNAMPDRVVLERALLRQS